MVGASTWITVILNGLPSKQRSFCHFWDYNSDSFVDYKGHSISSVASLIAQMVKNPPAMQETQFDCRVGKIRWRRDRLPTPIFLGFPCGSSGKESACNARDLSLISGLGKSPGEGKGYPLQYSGLENSIDYTVHGVVKSRTQLSNFHFHFSDVQMTPSLWQKVKRN